MTIEQDVLWSPEFDTPDDGYRRFRETWLRLAANIAQEGTCSLLVGAGVPSQFEACCERSLFSSVHYAALVCADSELEFRLFSRPGWRRSDPDFIARMLEYNRWLTIEGPTGDPQIAVFDTTDVGIAESVDQVAAWAGGIAAS